MARFESAVFASTADWFQRAVLGEIYAALLLFELPTDLDSRIQLTLDAYAFEDPWSGAGRIDLRGDVAILDLSGIPSRTEAFGRALAMLGPKEDGLVEEVWQSWCPSD
jgi:hypothetical protein